VRVSRDDLRDRVGREAERLHEVPWCLEPSLVSAGAAPAAINQLGRRPCCTVADWNARWYS
jgi:hypothetical protein